MNWHYALNGEDRGPVDDAELQQLVQQGVITRETLVWHEGLSNWTPYGDTATVPPLPSVVVQEAPARVVCGLCGRSVPVSDTVNLNDKEYCAACKPQVLQRLQEGVAIAPPEAEATRKLHLKHEASVKSIGLLYYLGGVGSVLIALGMTPALFAPDSGVESWATAVFLLVIGVAELWTAGGLRKLKPWSRIPTGIISGIGLLAFPLGTIINAYILYLLFSKKGKTVFSPEYQEVIRQTPHLKYKTSIVIWILLGLIVVLILGVVVGAIFRR